jgi:hypothetical protein
MKLNKSLVLKENRKIEFAAAWNARRRRWREGKKKGGRVGNKKKTGSMRWTVGAAGRRKINNRKIRDITTASGKDCGGMIRSSSPFCRGL